MTSTALSIILTFLISATAWGANQPPAFVLPVKTDAQKQLAKMISESEYRSAAQMFPQAYGSTKWGRSTNGTATYSWLLFKSGLETTGLEMLFSIKNPAAINKDMRRNWQNVLSPTSEIWLAADIQWKTGWEKVFPYMSANWSKPFPSYYARSKKQLRALAKQVKRARSVDEKAWTQWQLALSAISYNQTTTAHKYLDQVEKLEQNSIAEDLIKLTRGRAFYQDKRFDEAIDQYDQVSKSSDYWLEAVEEKAWAFLRKDDHERTLSEAKTLLAPLFAPQLGPEPYFLTSLTQLKVCDYPGVFKTIGRFKKGYRDRLQSLQELANKGTSESSEKLMTTFASGEITWKRLGPTVHHLPRFFNRDGFLRRYLLTRQQALKEASTISAHFSAWSNASERKRHLNERQIKATKKAKARLQALARQDLEEISGILQRLHLVEAEAIQRIHVADKPKGEAPNVHANSDALVFPVTDEVWLDEIDNFHVRVKDCKLQKRKYL